MPYNFCEEKRGTSSIVCLDVKALPNEIVAKEFYYDWIDFSPENGVTLNGVAGSNTQLTKCN